MELIFPENETLQYGGLPNVDITSKIISYNALGLKSCMMKVFTNVR